MSVNSPAYSRRTFLQNTATTAALAGSAGGGILGTMMGAGIGLLRQGTSETPKEQPKPNEPSKDKPSRNTREKQRAWVRPEETRAPITWLTENVVVNDALTGGLVGAGIGTTGGLVIENKIFGEYPEDCDGWPSKES